MGDGFVEVEHAEGGWTGVGEILGLERDGGEEWN